MKKVDVLIGKRNQTMQLKLKGLEPGFDNLFLHHCGKLGDITRYIHYDQKSIHEAFGNKTSYTGYIVIDSMKCDERPTKTYQATFEIRNKSSFQELTETIQTFLTKKSADPRTVTIYYYLPESKSIFVIRDAEILVIDYANYDYDSPGDTAVFSMTGLETPLKIENYVYDWEKLSDIITTHCKELFSVFRAHQAKDSHSCSACQKQSEDALEMCSRCRAAYYCNAVCQNAHWPIHKETCQKVSKARDGKVIKFKKAK